jgi:protein-S-isoprenylcysteine O-methyltransferase Ste14
MIAKMLARTAIWVAMTAVTLFLSANTLNWPGAWVYLAEIGTGGIAIGLWLAKHDPALLAERLSAPIQRSQKFWDKVWITIVLFVVIVWVVLMAFDAARYHWSHVPVWVQAIGAVGILLSMYFAYLTFRVNTFAAPVVKIQAERAQTVVATGPYSCVRHPLYAGALFYIFGTPMLLGSWYGLAAAPVLMILLAIRIVMEERTLAAELRGYTEYAARVRYRLIPLVW